VAGQKIADANARQREAELKILEMREKLGPRKINAEVFKEALAGVPRKGVVISFAPNDPDTSQLSLGIAGALTQAGGITRVCWECRLTSSNAAVSSAGYTYCQSSCFQRKGSF
jgi:hypothetical protein